MDAMDVTSLCFWILVALIASGHLLRARIVTILIKNHPFVYERFGRPAKIGSLGFFIFRLSGLKEYKNFSPHEKHVVRFGQSLAIMLYIFLCIYFISLYKDHFGIKIS